MEDVFNEELDSGYDTLIYVSISSNGSGMYQNAVLTAREVMENRGGEIIVVDSQGFTCIYGAPVIHAAKMVSAGESKEACSIILTMLFQQCAACSLWAI